MSIIVSPHGGMGNRLRAIASVAALAALVRKNIYHYWIPIKANSPHPFVRAMQSIGLDTLFVKSIEKCPDNIKPDICFSEWTLGDYWYQYQSTTQQLLEVKNIVKIGTDANIIVDYMSKHPEKNVLIETSLIMKMKNIDEQSMNNLMTDIYATFSPQEKYLRAYQNIPLLDYGISIRRGEFLHYFPEANQNFADIRLWLNERCDNFVIFSDDYQFRDKMKATLCHKNIFDIDRTNLEPWEQGFVEFLCLAHRCSKIYGTPSSSFAIEASKFGNKHYAKILDVVT